MNRLRSKSKKEDVRKITMLVAKLNHYRHEYYNKAKPSVSDAAYDHLFDELQKLEKKTGIILSNSPTQTVGFEPVSALEKVRHPIPLLSLDKTKQTEELLQMARTALALLMLKLDGLTIKLCYENGQLAEASTRGDGDVGEVITHNIPAFHNVPTSIPHKGRLVITGEGFIHKDDFDKMKVEVLGKEDKTACNARNLASGSIRLLNPAVCRERNVYFYAFNILEGMPVERKSVTIEKAMVKWIKQIQGSLQVQYGKNVPESEILKVILKKDSFLPRSQVNHIRETLREQIRGLELELEEREFDLQYTNVIYVGGGAVAVKNFSEPRSNVAFDPDIHVNAKGYEFLAMQILKKQGAA